MITASICTIGDEILIGQVVDTNSSMISRTLGREGIRVTDMISIGDDRDVILGSLRKQLGSHDIVITTGGLGPTKDDITKEALATLSGSRSNIMHEGQLEVIHRILHARGLDVLDVNRAQALVPDTCEVIVNQRGTAPIMVFRLPEAVFPHKPVLYAMPGVPFETEAALEDVAADIRNHFETGKITHRTIMTYGLAESALAKRIASWEDSLPESMHLAYLPDPLKGVRLRLSMYGDYAPDQMQFQIDKLCEIIGDYIYSFEDESLEQAVGKALLSRGMTLSAAESCTGGEIAHLITSVPGSSAYFLGSVTSYAISVKERVLGVPAETIERFGVVSSEVAIAMAEGVKKLTGSDFAVATTGWAGPGGGDSVNPEGTVWVAVAGPDGTESIKFRYTNDRLRNIPRFAASALNYLLGKISERI